LLLCGAISIRVLSELLNCYCHCSTLTHAHTHSYTRTPAHSAALFGVDALIVCSCCNFLGARAAEREKEKAEAEERTCEDAKWWPPQQQQQ